MGLTPDQWNEIEAVVKSVTDKPWFSWAAHIDKRRNAIYWGSDFICEPVSPTQVEDALNDYIENKMRTKVW